MRIQVLGFIASAAVLVPLAAQDKVPDPRTYDYAGQIAALQAADHRDLASASGSADMAGVPKTFRLRTDIPLTAVAMEAVRVSEKLRTEASTPVAGSDGRVLYSYGTGLPTVVCAPLRVCIVELQAGERIEGEPQIGDAVRWHVSPATYGKGDGATSVLILKPQSPGLDTNLVVTTDRRAYYLRLISKPEDYVARVAFQYPEDDSARKWQIHLQEQRAADREAKRSAEVLPAIVAVEKLNFGYRLDGGNEHIRPLRVFDDGSKTYIQMRPELKHREAPALLVLGADGKGTMTNYRVHNQTYIVDRLFDRARLMLGSGKKAPKVEISREPRG
jgi:type IV secretion system protein TrbG